MGVAISSEMKGEFACYFKKWGENEKNSMFILNPLVRRLKQNKNRYCACGSARIIIAIKK